MGSGRGRGFADVVLSRLLDSAQPPGWGRLKTKGVLDCRRWGGSRTAGDSMNLCTSRPERVAAPICQQLGREQGDAIAECRRR